MNNFALVREVSRAGLIVLGRLSHVLTRTLLAQFNLGLLLHTLAQTEQKHKKVVRLNSLNQLASGRKKKE